MVLTIRLAAVGLMVGAGVALVVWFSRLDAPAAGGSAGAKPASQPRAGAAPEGRRTQNPRVCLAYDPRSGTFGSIGVEASLPIVTSGMCPENYAYYTVRRPAGRFSSGAYVTLSGSCCPLPSADILSSEHSFHSTVCPEDSVATGAFSESCGGKQAFTYEDSRCVAHFFSTKKLIRCTRINTAKYTLGPISAGLRVSQSAHLGQAFEPRTSRSRVPPAVRYAGGREGRRKWSNTYCIGYPWGSLLVGKEGKSCSSFSFRQLRYRRDSGSHKAGDPVRMFPDCLSITNPLDPDAQCVHAESRSAARREE